MTQQSIVIHISKDAHAAVKRYCQAAGVSMAEWSSAALIEAVKVAGPTRPGAIPVPRRAIERYGTIPTDVYMRPPFYAKPKPTED